MEPIINRVAESDIETFDLEKLWDGREVVAFDLAEFLVEGLVLREKAFRDSVKSHDWNAYEDRHVAIHCSTDAIIPTWASMLVTTKLDSVAATIAFGSADDVIRDYYVQALENVDWSLYKDKPVVIKGCANRIVPANAYLLATQKLKQVAKKLMYGEACSAVPLWRKKSVAAQDLAAKPVGIGVAGLPKGRKSSN